MFRPTRRLAPAIAATLLAAGLAAPGAQASPDLSSSQSSYFEGGATGLNVRKVSAVPGALGDGIQVADIELGANVSHEDLVRSPSLDDKLFTPVGTPETISDTAHGTKVASIINAKRDGVGIDGIAPHAAYHLDNPGSRDFVTTFNAATAGLSPGDVILIEVSASIPDGTHVPFEYWPEMSAIVVFSPLLITSFPQVADA